MGFKKFTKKAPDDNESKLFTSLILRRSFLKWNFTTLLSKKVAPISEHFIAFPILLSVARNM